LDEDDHSIDDYTNWNNFVDD